MLVFAKKLTETIVRALRVSGYPPFTDNPVSKMVDTFIHPTLAKKYDLDINQMVVPVSGKNEINSAYNSAHYTSMLVFEDKKGKLIWLEGYYKAFKNDNALDYENPKNVFFTGVFYPPEVVGTPVLGIDEYLLLRVKAPHITISFCDKCEGTGFYYRTDPGPCQWCPNLACNPVIKPTCEMLTMFCPKCSGKGFSYDIKAYEKVINRPRKKIKRAVIPTANVFRPFRGFRFDEPVDTEMATTPATATARDATRARDEARDATRARDEARDATRARDEARAEAIREIEEAATEWAWNNIPLPTPLVAERPVRRNTQRANPFDR